MSAPPTDRFAAARAVADAVLYEGYVLYPYRASARKNQLRWQFGVLAPPAVRRGRRLRARRPCGPRCVVDPGGAARRPRAHPLPAGAAPRRRGARPTAASRRSTSLDVDGVRWVAWDEAVEHEVDLAAARRCCPSPTRRVDVPLASPAGDDDRGARRRRRRASSAGRCAAREPVDGLVARRRPRGPTGPRRLRQGRRRGREHHRLARPSAPTGTRSMRRSLVAVHTLLAVDDGAFVSLLDPPRRRRARPSPAARNDGTFPVLIGAEGDADVVLSSPIILYDHPAVAPESPATSATRPRSTRSSPCGCSPSPTTRRPRRGAPTPAPRRSSTAATTCRPRSGSACTARSARSARRRPRRGRRRARGAAVVGSGRRRRGRPVDRHHVDRRGRGRQGHAGPPPPLPAGRRPRPLPRRPHGHGGRRVPRRRRRRAPGRHARRRPGRRAVRVAGPLPLLPPRRGRGAGMSAAEGPRRRHRQHLPRRRRLRRRGGRPPGRPGRCPTASGSPTSASAASTSPTSCSTGTTPWSWSTPCRWASRPGTVAVIEPELGRRRSATRRRRAAGDGRPLDEPGRRARHAGRPSAARWTGCSS